MKRLAKCSTINRRLFIGCACVSTLSMDAMGRSVPAVFMPRNELEHRLSKWVAALKGTIHESSSQHGAPVYCVELDRNQWESFYAKLADNFTSLRVGRNNLVGLRSGEHAIWLQVA